MGISIKRQDTEKLAREVAALAGESLTDAIHNSLTERIKKLGSQPSDDMAKMMARLAVLDQMEVRDNRSLSEMERDFYDDSGQPI